MPTPEHLEIYSGNKLILQGNYWVTRVGKCGACGNISKLSDDIHCDECTSCKHAEVVCDG